MSNQKRKDYLVTRFDNDELTKEEFRELMDLMDKDPEFEKELMIFNEIDSHICQLKNADNKK